MRTSERRLASLWASEIGKRHQLLGLVAGVAEHHPLVAGAGDVELVLVGGVVARLICRVDALGDVGGLFVDRVDDRTGVAVEAVAGVVVADLAHGLAGDVLDVDVGVGGDLPGDDDQAGVDERLAGDAPVGVVCEHGVEHPVGDLVGDLVGVALRDRLGGEQELAVRWGVRGGAYVARGGKRGYAARTAALAAPTNSMISAAVHRNSARQAFSRKRRGRG